jgi:hypothetical protein
MARTVFESPVLGGLLCGLSNFYLKVTGWRKVGRLPDIPRCVMIAAPHTSNWDAPIALSMVFAFRLKAHWLVKAHRFPMALPGGPEMAQGDPHRPDEVGRRGDPDGR